MHNSTYLAALVSVVLAVTASPIEHRATGGVLKCTGIKGTGTCEHRVVELDTCHQLEKPFYKNTNTFSPDAGNLVCYPYLVDCNGVCRSPTGCTFGAVDSNYVHKNNLSAIHWNGIIRSYSCSAKTS